MLNHIIVYEIFHILAEKQGRLVARFVRKKQVIEIKNPIGLIDCETCLFKTISCQFIDRSEFDRLMKRSTQLRFKKGETILKQGAATTHLVFLQSGIVKFSLEQEETGKNTILTISRAPSLIGGANIFNEGLNMFSVTAIEDCHCCFIEVPLLKEIAMANPNYLMKLLEIITGMFKVSILNFISIAHKQVNGRIACVLLYLSASIYKKSQFTLSLSRKELAEFAGCSTENVIHTLSRFHREGILEVDTKNITIKDAERLKKISKVG
jgi:CRP/FNR family transcriptional regulator